MPISCIASFTTCIFARYTASTESASSKSCVRDEPAPSSGTVASTAGFWRSCLPSSEDMVSRLQKVTESSDDVERADVLWVLPDA
jgi:hypothetical protein